MVFYPRPFYHHLLTSIALLHLSNILYPRARPGKSLHPLPIPPDFPRQTVPPHRTCSSCMDGLPHRYICLRHRLPVHACRTLMGPVCSWEMRGSAGFRVCRCCSEHFRGHRHHVSPSVRVECFDTELEEEARLGLHVRSRFFVSIPLLDFAVAFLILTM